MIVLNFVPVLISIIFTFVAQMQNKYVPVESTHTLPPVKNVSLTVSTARL